jgi:hypothetical protein
VPSLTSEFINGDSDSYAGALDWIPMEVASRIRTAVWFNDFTNHSDFDETNDWETLDLGTAPTTAVRILSFDFERHGALVLSTSGEANAGVQTHRIKTAETDLTWSAGDKGTALWQPRPHTKAAFGARFRVSTSALSDMAFYVGLNAPRDYADPPSNPVLDEDTFLPPSIGHVGFWKKPDDTSLYFTASNSAGPRHDLAMFTMPNLVSSTNTNYVDVVCRLDADGVVDPTPTNVNYSAYYGLSQIGSSVAASAGKRHLAQKNRDHMDWVKVPDPNGEMLDIANHGRFAPAMAVIGQTTAAQALYIDYFWIAQERTNEPAS